MQQPKPRKEALSGCGCGCETADVARAPTIHEGLVVFTVHAAGREIREARFLASCPQAEAAAAAAAAVGER
jgi:hypothetical protein